jgi:hypothetical protein
MMRKSRDFSRSELLATIREAEELAGQVDALREGQEQTRLIYRWAEIADEVALLMVMAEEVLPPDELAELRGVVNGQDVLRWEKYRRNIRWMNRPMA